MTPATPQTAAPICNAENPQRPSLLTIPRELRDMITAPFLQSGDLVILCICRMITEEALQRIKKEATFRVYFDIKDRKNNVLGKDCIPAGLHNVDIHFNFYWGGSYMAESAFDSSSIRKLGNGDHGVMERCNFTIYYDTGIRGPWEREVPSFETLDALNKLKEVLPRGPRLLPMVLYTLSRYTYFNTLVIKIVRDPHHNYWKFSSEDRLCLDASDLGLLRRKLEPALGSAQFINNNGDCHLEFHPRAYSSPPIKMNLTATRCRPWYPPYSVIMDHGHSKGYPKGVNIKFGPCPGYGGWPWKD